MLAEPSAVRAHVALSLVERVLGDTAAARRAAEQATSVDPSDPRGHRSLAWALFAEGRFAASETAVLRALELDPGDSSAHLLHARLLAACARPLLALRAASRAVAIDPGDPEARELLADRLVEVDPASWELPALPDPVADDVPGQALQGAAHLVAGHPGQAEESLRQALEADPRQPLAIAALAGLAEGSPWAPVVWLLQTLRRLPFATRAVLLAVTASLVASLLQHLPPDPDLALTRSLLAYGWAGLCAVSLLAGPALRFVLRLRHPWLRELW